MFHKVANRVDFIQVLAFDKWVGNCDGRQAIFRRKGGETHFRVAFIDQGYCFDAAEWSFPDLPLLETYHQIHVYQSVTGWHSFEPVLSRIEMMDYADLRRCAAASPHDWFEHDGEGALCAH